MSTVIACIRFARMSVWVSLYPVPGFLGALCDHMFLPCSSFCQFAFGPIALVTLAVWQTQSDGTSQQKCLLDNDPKRNGPLHNFSTGLSLNWFMKRHSALLRLHVSHPRICTSFRCLPRYKPCICENHIPCLYIFGCPQ